MSEPHFYTVTLDTPPSMSDLHGYVRPAALQSLLLTAATGQLELLGAGRDRTIELLNAVWILARIRFELYHPVLCCKPVEVTTWSADAKGAGFQREAEFYANGGLVARAAALWCLADLESRKLLRPAALLEKLDLRTAGPQRFPAPGRLKLPAREGEPYYHTVRYSDVDMNRHLHNARYTDLCCDALALEQTGELVREFQINYTAECRPGERIAIYTERAGETALLCGVGPEEKIRFEAAFTLEQIQ